MRPAYFPVWLPALVLALPLPGHTAEWSAEPDIVLKSGYNDNIRLTSAPHDSVWETYLIPSVRFGVANENQGLYGDARVSIQRFSGGSGANSSSQLDRENYFLATTAYHQTLRNAFRANLDYSERSTRDAELDEFGNVVNQEATLQQLTLGPSWDRTLNERTWLNVAYQATSVDFPDDPGVSDLIAYDYDFLTTSLVRQITPRMQGTLSASYSRYQPDTVAGLNSNTLSYRAGISRNFSETLVASFHAGQRQTTSDTLIATGFCIGAEPGSNFPTCTDGTAIPTGTAKDETRNNGSVYSASITKTLETSSLSAAISRASNPTSQGQILDTTRYSLIAAHQFSETLRADLSIKYNTRDVIVNQLGREPVDQTTRSLLRIGPTFSWKWRREWVFGGEYRYTESKDQFSRKATGNAVYLTLRYRPTKMYVSR